MEKIEKENKTEKKKDTDNVHAKHRERLRRRYVKEGFNSFEQHNILEFILFYFVPRKDTNVLAHDLLKHFNYSFVKVLDAPIEELMKVKGIKEITATNIHSISDVIRKYNCEKVKEYSKIDSLDLIKRYLLAYYTNYTVEAVFLICLNNKMKIIQETELFKGSVNSSLLDLRKITEVAFSKNAASVVIAHNHPDGFTTPSNQDKATTRNAYHFLKECKIELKEHFIVADGECRGILQESLNS